MDQARVGKFIAELRRERGMTQEELGASLGVTNKTVSRWETGAYLPDIATMQALCGMMGVGINELIGGRRLGGEEFKAQADQNMLASLDELKKLKKKKAVINFLSGGGTGMLIGGLMSSASPRRTIVIAAGLVMVAVGMALQSNFDRLVFRRLGGGDD